MRLGACGGCRDARLADSISSPRPPRSIVRIQLESSRRNLVKPRGRGGEENGIFHADNKIALMLRRPHTKRHVQAEARQVCCHRSAPTCPHRMQRLNRIHGYALLEKLR